MAFYKVTLYGTKTCELAAGTVPFGTDVAAGSGVGGLGVGVR